MPKQYAKPTCRGSYFLGTACGKCERCEDERNAPARLRRIERDLRSMIEDLAYDHSVDNTGNADVIAKRLRDIVA